MRHCSLYSGVYKYWSKEIKGIRDDVKGMIKTRYFNAEYSGGVHV